ncbi:MAG: carbon storage regulator CsrA [Campylobacterota bacterium]
MLILSRKLDESIIIGKDIEVKVISIDGSSVKIGIEAPKDVDIIRHELYDAVKDSNLEAGNQEIEEKSFFEKLKFRGR